MSYKHQLSLEVPETNNCTILRVIDTSVYDEHVPVTCGLLEITAPGFNEPVRIDVEPEFSLIITACDLGLQTMGCGETLQTLPDGVYDIKYSVSPNDKVFVEYHYLRICQINAIYFNELCKLELAACEPEPDVKDALAELRMIRNFIDAAKAKVEYCDDVEQGMELYKYAKCRLDKFRGQACSTGC